MESPIYEIFHSPSHSKNNFNKQRFQQHPNFTAYKQSKDWYTGSDLKHHHHVRVETNKNQFMSQHSLEWSCQRLELRTSDSRRWMAARSSLATTEDIVLPSNDQRDNKDVWLATSFLKVKIIPEILQGSINQESGKIDAIFKGKFWFSIGNGYKPPPLIVETARHRKSHMECMEVQEGRDWVKTEAAGGRCITGFTARSHQRQLYELPSLSSC
ncbi:hypothetical protein Dimus_000339 [Dionaea muscipula]